MIFWMVNSNERGIHFSPSAICGNQKWNGALPNFIIRVEILKYKANKVSFIKIVEIIRIYDLDLWIKKYFIIASLDNEDSIIFIIVINDSIFNSNEHHSPNQDELIDDNRILDESKR